VEIGHEVELAAPPPGGNVYEGELYKSIPDRTAWTLGLRFHVGCLQLALFAAC